MLGVAFRDWSLITRRGGATKRDGGGARRGWGREKFKPC